MKALCKAVPGVVLLLLVSLNLRAATVLVAEIEPFQKVVLSAEVTGVVNQLSVSLGDRVTADQALVAFDATDYQLTVDLARARVKLSQAERKAYQRQLERLQKLYNAKNISGSQLDEQQRLFDVSQAELQVNRLGVRQARQELKKTRIRAPFDAVVSQTLAEQGQLLNPGDPVLELVAIDQVKIVFYLLERDYQQLHIGDQVEIQVPVLEAFSQQAAVSHIAPAETGQKPGYRVEAVIANPQGVLKPGFSARVTLSPETIVGDSSQ
ncbi:MAG: efflux RND transporter periplasmic adaptor subunit [Amphritea sp.]|nr:efflux RND transporter periplasmic adaptor subunit [Amphritea sp.]